MRLTPCECEQPGWCERHQCHKSHGMLQLCRHSPQYFEAFESGHVPSLFKRATNFAKAAATHAADLGRKVSDEVYDSRLSVCRGCELCDEEKMQCLHYQCGCNLEVKARWRTQKCPRELWPELEPDSSKPPIDENES